MKKRKTNRAGMLINPFQFYSDIVTASVQMAELYTSSAQVIAHRAELINQALQGKRSLYDKEFSDMWSEKLVAGNESWMAGIRHMANGNPHASALSAVIKTVEPYRKKASANARRLNKRVK